MVELGLTIRRLRTRPVATAIAILALAVGIAATGIAFSLVEGILWSPLPVESEDELVIVWHENPARDFAHIPFSPAAFDRLGRGVDALRSVGAYESAGARAVLAEGRSGPLSINHVRVAGDFFGSLGATPAAGRLLRPEDDAPGAEPVVVVSHSYWMARAGGDPGLVGSVLSYGGRDFEVVGVAPEGLDLPPSTEVWATLRGAFGDGGSEEPIGVELDIVGRLASGVTVDQLASDVARIVREDPELSPVYGTLTPVVVPFPDHLLGSLRPVLHVVTAAALVLLLAAVVNAALLFVSRGTELGLDLAVRRTLGASRSRVLRPLMTDALVTAAVAFVVGTGMASWAAPVFSDMVPPDVPQLRVSVDLVAFLLAALVGTVAMLTAALLVGLVVSRRSLRDGLINARLGSRRRGLRGGDVLVGVQVSLAVVASVGSVLLVRSVANLTALDRGFESDGLTIVRISHPHELFEVPESYVTGLENLVARLEQTPGVVSATPGLNPPMTLSGGIDVVPTLEGQAAGDADANPFVSLESILPGYFETVGTAVVEGRGFGPRDSGGAPAAVVNEAAAQALWPGEPALGQRLRVGLPGYEGVDWTIVGVVEDSRYRSFPDIRPGLYLPLTQFRAIPPGYLLVRTDEGGRPVMERVADALSLELPEARMLTSARLDDILARPTARPRFAAAIALSFSVLTLALTALGIYGVFTVLVQERQRELGVRSALGATGWQLARVVVDAVGRVGLAGLAAGISISLWVNSLIESLLFGVHTTDPGTLAAVSLTMVAVAFFGAGAPAVRAIRADPLSALRSD